MSKLVRVKLPATGAQTTVSEAYAKRRGLTIVDAATHDAHGRVLAASKPAEKAAPAPATPKTTTNAPQGGQKKEGGK